MLAREGIACISYRHALSSYKTRRVHRARLGHTLWYWWNLCQARANITGHARASLFLALLFVLCLVYETTSLFTLLSAHNHRYHYCLSCCRGRALYSRLVFSSCSTTTSARSHMRYLHAFSISPVILIVLYVCTNILSASSAWSYGMFMRTSRHHRRRHYSNAMHMCIHIPSLSQSVIVIIVIAIIARMWISSVVTIVVIIQKAPHIM